MIKKAKGAQEAVAEIERDAAEQLQQNSTKIAQAQAKAMEAFSKIDWTPIIDAIPNVVGAMVELANAINDVVEFADSITGNKNKKQINNADKELDKAKQKYSEVMMNPNATPNEIRDAKDAMETKQNTLDLMRKNKSESFADKTGFGNPNDSLVNSPLGVPVMAWRYLMQDSSNPINYGKPDETLHQQSTQNTGLVDLAANRLAASINRAAEKIDSGTAVSPCSACHCAARRIIQTSCAFADGTQWI